MQKKWMRLQHPESIHETVLAHKRRIIESDPRFDVNVSLVNDHPHFNLLAKEPVPLTFTFQGDQDRIGKKVSDLVDKGASVEFRPGELKITGSKLFEKAERIGCTLETRVSFPCSLAIVCWNESGIELARLSDVSGHFSGGKKELSFEGELPNSPLALKLSPIAIGMGGSAHFNLNLHRWESQPLLQLAYFDRLNQFFQSLPKSATTTVECWRDGNIIFSLPVRLQDEPFAIPLANFLEKLWKARKVAQRFSINPLWTGKTCNRETLEDVEQHYAIFFEDGWTQATPNVRLNTNRVRKTLGIDLLKKVDNPGAIRVESDWEYAFFGETINAGRLVHDYSHMSMKLVDEPKQAKTRRKGQDRNHRGTSSQGNWVRVAFVGTESTITKIRAVDGTSSEQVIEHV